MMTVHEVSELTGVSVRALHHYDQLGLLKPAEVTEAGYRLYDEDSLTRLQSILLFRELQFPLKDIGAILDSPTFDRNRALDQQIQLLELRKEHLENLIDLAKGIKGMGVKHLTDFRAFDTKKIDEYAREAKASWGKTPEWQEYEQKSKGRTRGPGPGTEAPKLHHGALLHLLQRDPAEPVQDVRRGWHHDREHRQSGRPRHRGLRRPGHRRPLQAIDRAFPLRGRGTTEGGG